MKLKLVISNQVRFQQIGMSSSQSNFKPYLILYAGKLHNSGFIEAREVYSQGAKHVVPFTETVRRDETERRWERRNEGRISIRSNFAV